MEIWTITDPVATLLLQLPESFSTKVASQHCLPSLHDTQYKILLAPKLVLRRITPFMPSNPSYHWPITIAESYRSHPLQIIIYLREIGVYIFFRTSPLQNMRPFGRNLSLKTGHNRWVPSSQRCNSSVDIVRAAEPHVHALAFGLGILGCRTRSSSDRVLRSCCSCHICCLTAVQIAGNETVDSPNCANDSATVCKPRAGS